VSGVLAAEPFVRWDWVGDHLGDIRAATIEHIRLTVIAVAVGFVISLGLAAVSLRVRRLYAPLAWATGLLYTIPSIALFTVLVQYWGLSTITAEVALVSYTLLILLRNIVAGVDSVPAPVKEAADGMGFTPWRRFVSVDLRLATPAIIAGLRIATVTTVGLVTVTALVGFGGLGSFIDDGLDRTFSTPIVVGAAGSIVLAVAFDALLALVGRVLTPWAYRRA
jgi:osmoprotectant transport system permease protein